MTGIRKIAIGMTLLVTLLTAGAAYAATNNAVVSGITNATVYKAGQTVTVTGVVNGDVFCAGQTVDIDATVNGDVICAGQNVTVHGTVNGNVRVAGQTVSVGARVTNAVSVVAQTATLDSAGSTSRDVTLAAQTASIDGKVGRDVGAAANTLTISSTIGRNLNAQVGDKLHLLDGSIVRGGVYYTSPNTLQKSGGAIIGGQVVYHKSQMQHKNNAGHGAFIAGHLFFGFSVLVFSMVLVALFPQAFAAWNRVGMRHFWVPLLTGFLAMFLVPVLLITLLVTVIGAPLALFAGLVWLLVLSLSLPIAAFYTGHLVMRHERRAPLLMLVGAVILSLISLLPILGWLVTIIAVWFGTGTVLVHMKEGYRKPEYTI